MRGRHAGNWWRGLCPDDGQDLMEYALVAALISLVALAVVSQVGITVRDLFWNVIASTVAAV
jgi:Flp pilus assembly pilin Flp